MPSGLEPFFAEGADAIGNNLDWWEAQWETGSYLLPLLDPTVPVTAAEPMAALLLALALAAKEPGQSATAVDILVRSRQESRLDVNALGMVMQKLLGTNLVMASRYARSLRAALRMDREMAGAIFELMCAAVLARPADPPRDTAKLLELLHETMLLAGRRLGDDARQRMTQLHIGGRGRTLLTQLLKAST
jgi:hypothetical protein